MVISESSSKIDPDFEQQAKNLLECNASHGLILIQLQVLILRKTGGKTQAWDGKTVSETNRLLIVIV